MAFRLALAMGCPRPDDLLERMTSQDVAEWHAFYTINPFGQEHTDYLIAQLTAALVNVHRGRGTQPRQPREFLPLYRPPEQSLEEIEAGILRAFGHGSRK